MKSLQEFYNDKATKENVHLYLIEFLESEAVRKVFNKEDVSAIAEARDVIDRAFENLDDLFQSKVKKKEQINESR